MLYPRGCINYVLLGVTVRDSCPLGVTAGDTCPIGVAVAGACTSGVGVGSMLYFKGFTCTLWVIEGVHVL